MSIFKAIFVLTFCALMGSLGSVYGAEPSPLLRCRGVFSDARAGADEAKAPDSKPYRKWKTALLNDQEHQSLDRGAIHLLSALSDVGGDFLLTRSERRALKVVAHHFEDAVVGSETAASYSKFLLKPRMRDLPWYFLPIFLRAKVDKFLLRNIHMKPFISALQKIEVRAVASRMGLKEEFVRDTFEYIGDPKTLLTSSRYQPHASRLMRPLFGLILLGLINMDPYVNSLELVRKDFPLQTYMELSEQQIPGQWSDHKITMVYSSSLFSRIDQYQDVTPSIPELHRVQKQTKANMFNSIRVANFTEFVDAINSNRESDVFIVLAHGHSDNFRLGMTSDLASNMDSLKAQIKPLKPGSVIIFVSCALARGMEGLSRDSQLNWKTLARIAAPEGYAILSNQVISTEQLLPQYKGVLEALSGEAGRYFDYMTMNAVARPVAHLFGINTFLDTAQMWPLIEPTFTGEHTQMVVYDVQNDATKSIRVR